MKQFEYLRPDGKTHVGPVSLDDAMKEAKSRINDNDKPFIIIKDGQHRYPSINEARTLLHLHGILAEGHVGVRAVVHTFSPDGTKDPTTKHAGGKVGDALFEADRLKDSSGYDDPLRD